MIIEKPAATERPIHDLLARRWSGRAYDPQREVPREDLLALLEAARWAPSSFNDQPWRYLVWEKCRDERAWQRAFDCLVEFNQGWAGDAPVLMASVADSRFATRDRENRHGQHDTGAASMSLCVEATARGLMVHQMAGFDAEALRSAFDIPDRFTPMAMIAVGYQLPEERLSAEQRERELEPRSRGPLGERFFAGAWGRPIGE